MEYDLNGGLTSDISYGIFIKELLRLIEVLSDINEDDILHYNLDRHMLRSIKGQLKTKLEVELVNILDGYIIRPEYELDCDNIINEFELYLSKLDNNRIDYVKNLLYSASNNLTSLYAILNVLLLLKDNVDVCNAKTPKSKDLNGANNLNEVSSSLDHSFHTPLIDGYKSNDGIRAGNELPSSNDQTLPSFSDFNIFSFNHSNLLPSDRVNGIVGESFGHLSDDIISDLLCFLIGLETRYVRYDEITKSLVVNACGNISNGVYKLMNRIAYVGLLYNKLNNIKCSRCTITDRLKDFVLKYIMEYVYIINEKRNSKLTLRSLYALIHPWYIRFKLLNLIPYDSDHIKILNCIYDLSLKCNLIFNDILNVVLVDYFSTIIKFITYGILDDTYNEFFIRRDVDFVIDYNKVFKFIPDNLVNLIHTNGKYAYFIHEIKGCIEDRNDEIVYNNKYDLYWNLQNLHAYIKKLDYSRTLASLLIHEYNFFNHLNNLIDSRSEEKNSGAHGVINGVSGVEVDVVNRVNKDNLSLSNRCSLDSSKNFSSICSILVIGSNKWVYDLLRSMNKRLDEALIYLNISSLEYIMRNKLYNGILTLIKDYNKINIHRCEMINFINCIKYNNFIKILMKNLYTLKDNEYIEMVINNHNEFINNININKLKNIIEIINDIINYNKLILNLFENDNININILESCYNIAYKFRLNIKSIIKQDYYINILINFNNFY